MSSAGQNVKASIERPSWLLASTSERSSLLLSEDGDNYHHHHHHHHPPRCDYVTRLLAAACVLAALTYVPFCVMALLSSRPPLTTVRNNVDHSLMLSPGATVRGGKEESVASSWWDKNRGRLHRASQDVAGSFLLHAQTTSSNSFCEVVFMDVPFFDMHDGDVKLVSLHEDGKIEIRSSSSSSDDDDNISQEQEPWIIHTHLDHETCTALVDFNVPHKPDPPPVPLSMTMWKMQTVVGSKDDDGVDDTKWTLEFTDPSGDLAPPHQPLNHWVQSVVMSPLPPK